MYLSVQRLTSQLELVSRVPRKRTLMVWWSQWEAQDLGGKIRPDSETVKIFVIPKDSGKCRDAVPSRREQDIHSLVPPESPAVEESICTEGGLTRYREFHLPFPGSRGDPFWPSSPLTPLQPFAPSLLTHSITFLN